MPTKHESCLHVLGKTNNAELPAYAGVMGGYITGYTAAAVGFDTVGADDADICWTVGNLLVFTLNCRINC
jgi:hypothetical protein